MLTQLQTAKLVYKTIHSSLDAKTLELYQCLAEPMEFWREVKRTFQKTTALCADHPLNLNMETLEHKYGLPVKVYDLFLNSDMPVSIPILLRTRPPQQPVSLILLSVLVEQYPFEHPQYIENQLLCARLCMQNQWSTKNIDRDFMFTISTPDIMAMWKSAYTHLPESELFAVPAQCGYFSSAVEDVFDVVRQRFPHLLGKLMNVALQERVDSQRSWLVAHAIEQWESLWPQLSAEHWTDVTLPLQEHNSNLLAPFRQRALIGSVLHDAPQHDTKRKM